MQDPMEQVQELSTEEVRAVRDAVAEHLQYVRQNPQTVLDVLEACEAELEIELDFWNSALDYKENAQET